MCVFMCMYEEDREPGIIDPTLKTYETMRPGVGGSHLSEYHLSESRFSHSEDKGG